MSRRSPRIRARFAATVHIAGVEHTLVCHTRDISAEGCFLDTAEMIAPGVGLSLALMDNERGEVVQVDGVVARCLPGGVNGIGRGVGVRLTAPPPGFLAELQQRYVSRTEGSRRLARRLGPDATVIVPRVDAKANLQLVLCALRKLEGTQPLFTGKTIAPSLHQISELKIFELTDIDDVARILAAAVELLDRNLPNPRTRVVDQLLDVRRGPEGSREQAMDEPVIVIERIPLPTLVLAMNLRVEVVGVDRGWHGSGRFLGRSALRACN